MRGKLLTTLVLAFIVSLFSLTALAQVEKKKTVEPKPQLYIVEETIVKPAKVSQYEVHVKKAVELFKKYNHPYPVYAYSKDNLHYMSVFPVNNFKEMDAVYKAFAELAKKSGEEFQDMIQSAAGTLEYSKYVLIRHIPQLSYIPETPRLKPEESNYIFCEYFYVEPTKEGEFAQIAKKWMDLYKEKNIPDGWNMYTGSLGMETPVFIVMFKAKSTVDYYTQEEKINKLLGEEAGPLMKETISLIRRVEHKGMHYRPDLTYIPFKEEKKE